MLRKIITALVAACMVATLAVGCSAESSDTGKSEVSVVQAGDITMPYAKIGNGTKTLVIIPGLSIKQVSPLIEAVGAQYQAFLDDGYTIYLFDRRTNAPEGYSVQDMAHDTAACLSELGIERADVAGVSQGGMIALYLAADNPQLVDHLLLGSTCARVNEALSKTVGEWIELAKDKNEAKLAESFGSLVYSDAVWEANKDAIIAENSGITDEEYARFIQMAQAASGYDCRDRLGAIEASPLVVGSKGDKVVTPEGTMELADLLGCESYMYDTSYGHAVYDEAPDYVSRLLEFCKR